MLINEKAIGLKARGALTRKAVKTWEYKDTQRVVYMASLVAIATLFKMWSGIVLSFEFGRLSLVYLPYFLAGIILGPAHGFAVGCITDLFSWLSGATSGPFNPLITLTNGMYGLVMGLIFKHTKYSIVVRVAIGGFVSAFVLTLLWGSYANFVMSTAPITTWQAYFARVYSRIVQSIFVFAQTFTLVPLVRALNKSVLKGRRIK